MENDIVLRKTVLADLDHFFEFQQDPEAIHLAAFTARDQHDRSAFLKKYSKFLEDPEINNQTIIYKNSIAGNMAKFILEGDAEITYWIDRKLWGKGIASGALKLFLVIENTRPLIARTAFDNLPSQKVLEKCGFRKIGHDKGFANARKQEIDEYIFKLT